MDSDLKKNKFFRSRIKGKDKKTSVTLGYTITENVL